MKKFLIGLMTITICMATVSCGSSESTNNGYENNEQAESTQELTPIESLDETEKTIYEAVIGTDFYSPADIRILNGHYSTHKACYVVQLQGKNKVGGTIQSFAYVHLRYDEPGYVELLSESDIGKLSASDALDIYDQDPEQPLTDSNITNINKAIQYYWEERGVN